MIKRVAILAVLGLALCAPRIAWANGHDAHAHHPHEAVAQADEQAVHEYHHDSTVQVEEIPAGGAEAATGHGSHSCPHHAGQPCSCPSKMALSRCSMGGCCYKPDMPSALSVNDGNLQEVASTRDASFLPTLSFIGIVPVSNGHPSRLPFPPDPRPPSARPSL